jgi:hypothetical protein
MPQGVPSALLFLRNGLVYVVLDFLFEPLPNAVAQARGPRRSHVIHSGETIRTMLVRLLRRPVGRRSSTVMRRRACLSAFCTVVRCMPAPRATPTEE